MPNRIDITFDEQGFATATKTSTELVALINSYIKDVKPEERKGGQSMGDGTGWIFAQKAFKILTDDRSLVHPHLVNYDAFARDITAAQKLLELKAILGNWVGNMEGTFILLGKDLMEQANFVLAAVKILADASSSSYKILYDSLNSLYELRAQKAATTMEQQKRISELESRVAVMTEAAKIASK